MTDDHAQYVEWDGAYVVGALSPTERREFELHLEQCDRCRASVAELTGLPGLLGRLDSARAFELLDVDDADTRPDERGDERGDERARTGDTSKDASAPLPTPPLPADLVARIERRQALRRRRRIGIIGGLAAAAVVTGAVAIPVSITSVARPTLTTALAQVVDSPLSADVKLTTVGWGTKVDMSCRYANDGSPADVRWRYALWVVPRSGSASELSSWSATSNSTVTLTAGTSVPVAQIAEVQVRSVDDGSVLLQSELH